MNVSGEQNCGDGLVQSAQSPCLNAMQTPGGTVWLKETKGEATKIPAWSNEVGDRLGKENGLVTKSNGADSTGSAQKMSLMVASGQSQFDPNLCKATASQILTPSWRPGNEKYNMYEWIDDSQYGIILSQQHVLSHAHALLFHALYLFPFLSGHAETRPSYPLFQIE